MIMTVHSVDSWWPPYASPCSTPASTRFEPPSPKAKVSPATTIATKDSPRAIVLVNACCRTLTAFSQGDWPLTCANAADARSETDFFRQAFFIAGEFPSDDASRAPHRDSKAMGQLGGGSPQLQLSAPHAHRPTQPSPARGYLSHTSTPNCRWQNRECCQQVPISPAIIFRHRRSARNPARVAFYSY